MRHLLSNNNANGHARCNTGFDGPNADIEVRPGKYQNRKQVRGTLVCSFRDIYCTDAVRGNFVATKGL